VVHQWFKRSKRGKETYDDDDDDDDNDDDLEHGLGDQFYDYFSGVIPASISL